MHLHSASGIVVSVGNSFSGSLAANNAFIGETELVDQFVEISLNLFGGPYGAPGSLYFEFSPDGINWDVSVLVGGVPILSPTALPPQRLTIILPYFRVRYENGGTLLTELRLTTVYHRTSASRLTRYLNQEFYDVEPVENVSSVIRYFDGNSYVPVSSVNRFPTTADQGSPAAISSAWPVEITDGTSAVGITDVLGNKALKVDVIKTVSGGGVGSGGTSSTFDDPFPSAGTAIGYSDGYYMRHGRVFDLNTSGATEYIIGTNLRTSGPTGSIEIGINTNPIFAQTNIPYVKTEYDLSSATVNYIGTAPAGTATSAAAWTIKKILFDILGNPTETLWSSNTAVWNNRTSETYT